MRPIALRDEEPPDDTIVVVRGGTMNSEYVRLTAAFAHEEHGMYAVSVFLALDESLESLCAEEPYLSRYGQIRLSTVSRIRAVGFVLLPTLDRPHYDIILPDLYDRTLERLEIAFDPPVQNPARS